MAAISESLEILGPLTLKPSFPKMDTVPIRQIDLFKVTQMSVRPHYAPAPSCRPQLGLCCPPEWSLLCQHHNSLREGAENPRGSNTGDSPASDCKQEKLGARKSHFWVESCTQDPPSLSSLGEFSLKELDEHS